MSTVDPVAAFTPTSRVIEPSGTDELAQAVLSGLERPARDSSGKPTWGNVGRPWGIFKTFLVGPLTFGILPLLLWPWRFRYLASIEQQQYWHLGEWLRLRTNKPQATELRDQATRQLDPGFWMSALPGLLALATVAAFLNLWMSHNFSWSAFWQVTLGMSDMGSEPELRPYLQQMGLSIFDQTYDYHPYQAFEKLCTALLTCGYAVHWFQICRRSGALDKFATQFNAVTATQGLAPIKIAGVGLGLQASWIITALISVLLDNDLIWMVPMALAGVVHSRYVLTTSPQARADFAARMRQMLPADPTAPGARAGLCVNEKCRVPLPPGAAFCPRCGARAS
jgi:hypothetical protein